MNNNLKQTEKYYKFANGKIFKYDMIKKLFYYLNDSNEWIADARLISKFFDASSDYEEINSFVLSEDKEHFNKR